MPIVRRVLSSIRAGSEIGFARTGSQSLVSRAVVRDPRGMMPANRLLFGRS